MTLEISQIKIKDLQFGERTSLSGRTLLLDPRELAAFIMDRDERIQDLAVHPARPGEPVRLICVKDVIEPRCKTAGGKTGEGKSLVLKNMAVVTCGRIIGFQEGIIDMSGPGAAFSPFSRTLNVVLEISVKEGISRHEHEEVIRTAGCEAAGWLAEKAAGAEPDRVEAIDQPRPDPAGRDLPKIAYVYLLLSQGLLHDTYVLGRQAGEGLPRELPLPVLMDGAIVSGNCVSACDKNTTWHHQNNPVLRQLYRAHNKGLNFAGTVLSNIPTRLAGKRESAGQAVELVKHLRPRGVIISKEGFGNPDADLMMLIHKLESSGIRTVAITDEFAGPNGASQSLADTTPEADAIISTGNANQLTELPPMSTTIGPIEDITSLTGAYPQSLRADGSLEIEIQGIIGATNEMGTNHLSCKEV